MPSSRRRRGSFGPALRCSSATVLALLVVSCGDDDLALPDDCFRGDRTVCGISDLTCQERIFDVVLCLRQVTTPMAPPTVVTMTPQQYADRIALPDVDSVESENRVGRALSLLGMFPADVDFSDEGVAFATDWIGGFYTDEDQTITIVSEGPPPFTPGMMALLAHEFVHAQQDVEHDLGAYAAQPVRGIDGVLARRAVVEGEATLYQIRFLTLMSGFELENDEWEAYLGQSAGLLLERIATSDFAYFYATSDFPYVFGLRLVFLAWRAGGPDAIDALFADPPDSTYTVLNTDAPEPYAADEEREAVEARIALPAGIRSTWSTFLGNWMFGAFLQANDPDSRFLARDWENDIFFSLWDEERGEAALIWVIWLRSNENAATAAAEINELLSDVEAIVETRDDRLTLIMAESPGLLTDTAPVALEVLDTLDAAEAAGQTAVISLGEVE